MTTTQTAPSVTASVPSASAEFFVVTRAQLDDLFYRTAKPKQALRQAVERANQFKNGMRVLRKTVWADWTEANEIPVVSERDLRVARAVSSVLG